MDNRVLELINRLKSNTNRVITLFQEIPPDKLIFKPSQNLWSIAENIEHIIVVNESYYPIIKQLHEKKYKPPFHHRFNFIRNYFEKMILKGVNPDRKKKMKTFPVWIPSQVNSQTDIVGKFVNHQNQLSDLIINSEEFIKNCVVIHSPASRLIVYSLEKAFDIIITHEARHINQAEELLIVL